MATIKPFKGVLPAPAYASSIAALPYDVCTRKEAKETFSRNPLSFLKIDRAEIQFTEETDIYSQQVYDKARDTLHTMISNGFFIQDKAACYYIYALTFLGRTQTGLVCCTSIDDYQSGLVRCHEHTRVEKELDRIRHIDTLDAQTGPILLAYQHNQILNDIISTNTVDSALFDFTCDDTIRHQVWRIDDTKQIQEITARVLSIDHLYIADGHHRAAAVVKVGLDRRLQYPDYNGTEEYNYFLSVLFPTDELQIWAYNRVIHGLNGYTLDAFLFEVQKNFDIKEANPTPPSKKGEFGMYLNGSWYQLTAHTDLYSDNPVDSLDVSLLQDYILNPLLGIQNPKTDSRIQFVGGIQGLDALVKHVEQMQEGISFSLYPTSMEELLNVADAGFLMPPKSTWFEPKLRSGLFIHIL